MTETEWLASEDPAAMLNLLRAGVWDSPGGITTRVSPKVSERKLRLFGCAWWRSIQPHSANQEREAQRVEDGERDYQWMLISNGSCLGCHAAVHVQRGAALLRDIIGNPFRPVIWTEDVAWPSQMHSCWLTSTVLSIAQGVYDERDFAAMPILADALEDAGADSIDILTHLRGAGPHVRGCWCLDLILGKE